jgi:hypothetical protein
VGGLFSGLFQEERGRIQALFRSIGYADGDVTWSWESESWMDMPMVWVISSDSDTRRLIGLTLSKRGLRIREISPEDELAPSGANPHLIILDSDEGGQVDSRAASALRQDPRLREVPLILILTAALTPSWLVPFNRSDGWKNRWPWTHCCLWSGRV